MDQHQRDVLGGRRGVVEQPSTDSSGRSSRPRTTTQRIEENSDGAASSPSVASVRSEAAVSESSASGSCAAHRGPDGADGPLVEELLLAGHQGDPAERRRQCVDLPRHQTPADTVGDGQRPRVTTPARRRGRPPRGRRPGRCGRPRRRPPRAGRSAGRGRVAVVVVGAHATPARPPGRGRAASRSSWWALPWCGIFSTSTSRPGQRPGQRRPGPCGSTSPVSRIRTPGHLGEQHHAGVVGRRAVAGPAVGGPGGGQSICRVTPTRRPSSSVRRRPRRGPRPARLGDVVDPRGGSSSRVTSTSPTGRPSSTPASPSTWSAWKWVSTSSGTRSTPSRSRQRSTDRGVRPGVDHDGRARPGAQHQRVALADVAGDQHPARRGGQPEVGGPHQHGDDQEQAAAEPGRPAGAAAAARQRQDRRTQHGQHRQRRRRRSPSRRPPRAARRRARRPR